MLNPDEHPVAWAMLMHELDDAHEHLGELIDRLQRGDPVDEDDFRVDLGHVYAHLNRAWNGRSDPDAANASGGTREQRTRFPQDLEPVG